MGHRFIDDDDDDDDVVVVVVCCGQRFVIDPKKGLFDQNDERQKENRRRRRRAHHAKKQPVLKAIASSSSSSSAAEVKGHHASRGHQESRDARAVASCVTSTALPILEEKKFKRYEGKVRDTYVDDDILVAVTTDRQSAFDRHLLNIPFKGAVAEYDGALVVRTDGEDLSERSFSETAGASERVNYAQMRGVSY